MRVRKREWCILESIGSSAVSLIWLISEEDLGRLEQSNPKPSWSCEYGGNLQKKKMYEAMLVVIAAAVEKSSRWAFGCWGGNENHYTEITFRSHQYFFKGLQSASRYSV